MAKKARVTCICYVEVEGANEYEALTEAEKMIDREYPLSDTITLIIKETVNITAEGCGVTYKKEENGNVRRYNCSEVLFEEFTQQGERESPYEQSLLPDEEFRQFAGCIQDTQKIPLQARSRAST